MLDVKAGDEQSFELLLRKYRTPLVNFLFRMVRDSAVAEDLAQEVFLRVYRARREYAPSAKFTTWMFRIAQIWRSILSATTAIARWKSPWIKR